MQRVARALSVSQPIFDGGYAMAATKDNAFGMLYAAFEEVHRYLSGLPVEGVNVDFSSGPIRHDAPFISTQPFPSACTTPAPVVPPSTSIADTDPPHTSLSSIAIPPTHDAPTTTALPAIPDALSATAPLVLLLLLLQLLQLYLVLLLLQLPQLYLMLLQILSPHLLLQHGFPEFIHERESGTHDAL